jgi:uncharacterized protein (DUF1919 family)
MNQIAKKIIFSIERSRLNNKDFVLISNNCWGYELYNALGREYNTPFVGLFLFPECYIQFLENFETFINDEIKFTKTSKYKSGTSNYPIGMLCGKIEIHFLHYSSENEAFEKWNRRTARLRKAMLLNVPLFVKFCDRDGCTNDHITRFHSLPFENKISIGVNRFNASNHLYQPKLKDSAGNFVIDGVLLYRKRYQYFDVSEWISSGKVCQSLISRCLALIS